MIGNDALNMELLYIFVKVSELKSINQSSEYLSLTQPAISKKIKQLEEYYEQELFIRSSKGMALTPIGQRVYLEAKQLISQVEGLRNTIRQKETKVNELRLGSLDSISSYLYPNFFVKSLNAFKSTTITNRIDELIEPFNQGRLDVIFMDSAFKDEINGIYSEKEVNEEPYFLVYSKDNPLINLDKESINPCTLQKMDLLMYLKYCPIHQRLVRVYQDLQMNPPKIVEIDYGESMIAMVAKSNYITVLPKSIAINKVTADISHLKMKEFEVTFTRKISLFSRDTHVTEMVNRMMKGY